MNIGVIGCGHVGLVTAVCLAELGHNVVAAESDAVKLNILRKRLSPIRERHLEELLQRHTGTRLQFCDSIPQAIRQAQVVFICVGTPSSRNGEADLSFVDAAICEISCCLRSHLLLVEKSTVPARTSAAIQRTMILNGVSPDSFSVASNPEFLREGTAVRDFLCPDRIVIGVDNERSRRLLNQLYRPLTTGTYYQRSDRILGEASSGIQVIETTPQSAELIKQASNAFLAMKISFINAVANIAEAVGADIGDVQKGLGSDPRIGSAFLDAGIGYGGSCLPKDLQAFRAFADEVGCRFDLLSEIIRINAAQRIHFLEKVRITLSPLRGKRLAVLGLAFKGGTDDIRESPAIEIVRYLIHAGARVVAFDPAAMDRTEKEFGKELLDFGSDPYKAMADADALLILTEWPEFAALDLNRVREMLRSPIVLDGRNLYCPSKMKAAGIEYVSIGRLPVRVDPKPRSSALIPPSVGVGVEHSGGTTSLGEGT